MDPKKKHRSIFSVSLRLLSLREHTRAELTRKLVQRGFCFAEVATVCDEFVERGYINDQRVADMCLSKAVRERKKGPQRLREEMLRRGFEPELISLTVAEYREQIDEQALALEWVLRLHELGKNGDYMKRFLSRRGFSGEAIIGALDKAQS